MGLILLTGMRLGTHFGLGSWFHHHQHHTHTLTPTGRQPRSDVRITKGKFYVSMFLCSFTNISFFLGAFLVVGSHVSVVADGVCVYLCNCVCVCVRVELVTARSGGPLADRSEVKTSVLTL